MTGAGTRVGEETEVATFIRPIRLTNEVLYNRIKMEDTMVEQLLDLIFEYGQNSKQPLAMRSLDVGDIVHLFHHYYHRIVDGWEEITNIQFMRLIDIELEDVT